MIDHERDAYELAARLAAAKDRKTAISELKAVVEQRDASGQLWELVGTMAYDAADGRLALIALEHASALKPLGRKAQLALAHCYVDVGHRETATTMLLYLAAAPDLDVELLESLAAGLGRCGQYEAALDVCRQAAQRLPDNTDPLIGIAHYMRRLRRPAELILPVLFQVHYLDPKNVETRVTLAWLLHESGRSDEGADLLEQVDCTEFRCVRCLTLMKHIFQRVGDHENAEVCVARLKALAGEWPGDNSEPTILE